MKRWMTKAASVLSVTAALALASGVALANDSGIDGYGGRWHLISGEHPTVQMVSERVTLDVFESDYTVRAEFTFHNDGPARQVVMGFPEQGYGDISSTARNGALKNFVTTVDGKRVVARRKSVKQDANYLQFNTYWIKTVPFGRQQTRHIVVSYRAPLGTSVARGIESFAVYAFTGGNWKGKVTRSDLTIHLREPGMWAIAADMGNDHPLAMTQRGATFTHTFRNWQAQEDFMMAFTRVPSGWLSSGEQDGAFGDEPVQTVTVPGRIKANATIQYLPPALWRDGRVWVRLGSLNDALLEKYPSTKRGDGGVDLHVYLTGIARTNEAILQTTPFDVTFQAGHTTMKVRDNTTKQTRRVTLPQAPWTLNTVQGGTLYVPAAAVAALWKGKITADPARHRFQMTFPKTMPR